MKTLIALFLSLLVTSAQAQNWVLVQESTDGARLLVDSNSWTITTDSKDSNSPNYVLATFRSFVNGKMSKNFVYVTEAGSCSSRSGLLYLRSQVDGTWETVNTYYWSKNGTKMYDSAGGALCDIFEVRIQENKEKNSPKSGGPKI